jgi:chromosome segregation ATPase
MYKSGVSVEISELQDKITSLENEKRRLLLQLSDVERRRDEAIGLLEKYQGEKGDVENSLRSRISELEQENKMIKRGFEQDLKDEQEKRNELRQALSNIKSEKDKLDKERFRLEDHISKMKKIQNDFSTFKDTILLTAKKILKNYELIESNLS